MYSNSALFDRCARCNLGCTTAIGFTRVHHKLVTLNRYFLQKLSVSKNEALTNQWLSGFNLVLRSEIPSGMCAKLRTVAASNNRDHPTRSFSLSPFTSIVRGHSPRSLHRDHSVGTLVIMFNCSHVNIGRASTPRSLLAYAIVTINRWHR